MQAQRGRAVDAAIMDGAKIAQAAPWIKRAFAVALWGFSAWGTGVQAYERMPYAAIGVVVLYTLLWQLGFSLAQFALRQQWQSIWYLGALAGSVVPSVLTYAPLVAGDLAAPMQGLLGYDGATWAAWAVVAAVMTLVDVVPEQILVRR